MVGVAGLVFFFGLLSAYRQTGHTKPVEVLAAHFQEVVSALNPANVEHAGDTEAVD